MPKKIWRDNRIIIEFDENEKNKMENTKNKRNGSEKITNEDIYELLEIILKILSD